MMQNTKLNYKAILKILGAIIFIIGVSMTIPWIYGEVTGDAVSARAFRLCTPPTMVLGAVLVLGTRNVTPHFRTRDGYLIVALCWVVASLVGAFPYFLSDFTSSYVDAFFESTSGFTTTGCTTAMEYGRTDSLILWKALSHWLGGMGILVFVISILPALGINGQFIARAEAPGPVLEKTTVRISDSARVLYLTYMSFTALEFVLLLLSGKMSAFDAIVNTMGSISTGGLIVQPEGVAYYDSVYVEIIISVFCILSSINFVLYHYLMTKKTSYFFRDIELRVYIAIIGCAVMVTTYSMIVVGGKGFGSALREAFFQTISMATTTGYIRNPSIIWPVTCQIVFVALLFIGGCAASTAGSLKVVRVIVMMKLIWRGCMKRIHPRSVVAVKLGDSSMSAGLVSSITSFILTYLGLFGISALFISFQGMDMEGTLTTTLAMLSNTGIAFDGDSVVGNFASLSPMIKLYLSALMIIGRLELFTIIILFTRNFWGRAR